MRGCKVEGCESKHEGLGFCKPHRRKFVKYGDPLGEWVSPGCSVEDCEETHYSKTYCSRHYTAFSKYGDPLARRDVAVSGCSVLDCEQPHSCKGYCVRHYNNFHRYGDPLASAPVRPIVLCSIDGCEDKHWAKSLCPKHYDAQYKPKYYQEHKEEIKARVKEYRSANPAIIRERKAKYYKANRERILAHVAEYAANNPEQIRAVGRVSSGRRRARMLAAPTVSFTSDQLLSKIEYWGGKCWFPQCDKPREEMDHVKPINKGGSHMLSNLRPACKHHNRSKADKWPLVEAAK